MLNKQQFPQLLTRINGQLYEEKETYRFKPMNQISAKARHNALERMAPDCPASQALALWDTTVFSSGKEGFLLAADGLYSDIFRRFKNGLPVPGKIHFDGLKSVEEDEGKRNHIRVTYADGSSYSVFASIYTSAVFWILDSVIAADRAAGPQPTPSKAPAPPQSAPAGPAKPVQKPAPPEPSAVARREPFTVAQLHHLMYDIDDMLHSSKMLFYIRRFDEVNPASRTLAMANIARGCSASRVAGLWDTADVLTGKEGFVLATDGLYSNYFRKGGEPRDKNCIPFRGLVYAEQDSRNDSYVRVVYDDSKRYSYYAFIGAKEVASILRMVLDEYAKMQPPVTAADPGADMTKLPRSAELLLQRAPRINWIQTIPDPTEIDELTLLSCDNPEQAMDLYTRGYELFMEWAKNRSIKTKLWDALRLWEDAARQDMLQAEEALGIYYLHSWKDGDISSGISHMKKAIESTSSLAPLHLGLGAWQGKIKGPGTESLMMKYMKTAANRGDGNGALYTAYNYYHGLTVSRDRDTAWKYVRYAAEWGNRDAAVTVGSLLAAGHRLEVNWLGVLLTLVQAIYVNKELAEPWELELQQEAFGIAMECLISQPDLQDLDLAKKLAAHALSEGFPQAERCTRMLITALRPSDDTYQMKTRKTTEELVVLAAQLLVACSKPDFARQIAESRLPEDAAFTDKQKTNYERLRVRCLTCLKEGASAQERNLVIAMLQQNQSRFLPEVDNMLGILMLEEGGIANEKRAYTYFQSAADKGSVYGLCNAAHCQMYGIGTAQDFSAATKMNIRACELGSRDACLAAARFTMGMADKNKQALEASIKFVGHAGAHGDIIAALITGEFFRNDAATFDDWYPIATTLLMYVEYGALYGEPVKEDYPLWAAEILLECFADNPKLRDLKRAGGLLEILEPKFPELCQYYREKLNMK